MAKVGENVKPIMSELAAGRGWPIQTDQFLTLALWMTMFTMSYEMGHRPTAAATATERRFLMQEQRPPDGWVVAVGRHEGPLWAHKVNHCGFAIVKPGELVTSDTKHHGQITVSTFGDLLFAVASGFPFPVDVHFRSSLMHIIWPPPTSVIESGDFVHNDDDVEWVAHAIQWAWGQSEDAQAFRRIMSGRLRVPTEYLPPMMQYHRRQGWQADIHNAPYEPINMPAREDDPIDSQAVHTRSGATGAGGEIHDNKPADRGQ
ncbi:MULTISPECIES: hypothetical protein [unclassified Sphingobium]|uniref:hypothetical protein n=1 Tax=unclassified Sphingobium TaxID=2611147 RepID=UPI0035A5ECD3